MQKITVIAAVAADGAIGRGGRLLFRISDDMRRFKRLTIGKPIVMGRHTFESLPSALSGRRNIVVTRNRSYSPAGAETAPDLATAIAMCDDAEEVMIIGGAQIYAEALPLANTLEITRIDASEADADAFFPDIDASHWRIVAEDGPHTDAHTGVTYTYVSCVRISPAPAFI